MPSQWLNILFIKTIPSTVMVLGAHPFGSEAWMTVSIASLYRFSNTEVASPLDPFTYKPSIVAMAHGTLFLIGTSNLLIYSTCFFPTFQLKPPFHSHINSFRSACVFE